jgi:hypothetical protein
MANFAADVSRIAKKMNIEAEELARGTFISLFTAVIKDTPVDSGALQGNWQTSASSPSAGIVDRTGADGATSEVKRVIQKPGVYYLTNNKPYAHRIEFDGWSHTKAPKGMVRINVRRIKSILKRQSK